MSKSSQKRCIEVGSEGERVEEDGLYKYERHGNIAMHISMVCFSGMNPSCCVSQTDDVAPPRPGVFEMGSLSVACMGWWCRLVLQFFCVVLKMKKKSLR